MFGQILGFDNSKIYVENSTYIFPRPLGDLWGRHLLSRAVRLPADWSYG